MPADRLPHTTELPGQVQLATIARRALGVVLDRFLVLVPVAVGTVAWGFRPGDEVSDDMVFVLNTAVAAVELIYATVMIAVFGRTIGKFATGTRVVRLDDGGRIGWLQAAQRAVVPVAAISVPQPEISLALTVLVYSMAWLGPFRQGLHDRAAGTIVIR